VDKTEKDIHNKELSAAYQGSKIERERLEQFESEKYYKVRLLRKNESTLDIPSDVQVKWTRVPDLVEKRRVFLKGGWAYVPRREQSSIVFQEFEVQLERALEVMA
jgi:DNA primase large subunit